MNGYKKQRRIKRILLFLLSKWLSSNLGTHIQIRTRSQWDWMDVSLHKVKINGYQSILELKPTSLRTNTTKWIRNQHEKTLWNTLWPETKKGKQDTIKFNNHERWSDSITCIHFACAYFSTTRYVHHFIWKSFRIRIRIRIV